MELDKKNMFIDNNGDYISLDINGNCFIFKNANKISKMITPVKCNHCQEIYDLTEVKVNRRFTDCDQFTTPCCNYKFADTRRYKSFLDYKIIK